jgi:eukaryotic translation initiation factor 2C
MFPLLMNKLPPQYKNKIVYNFSKNLYSLIPLPFDVSVIFIYFDISSNYFNLKIISLVKKVTYKFEIEGKTHTVTIKKINEIQVDPKQYDEQLTIQILDLIFTQNFNYSCVGINRSFFKEGLDYFQLGFGLELWRGAYSSVRPSEVGLTWNVDSMFCIFNLLI